MKILKHLVIALFSGVFVFGLVFLLVAFVEFSFNPVYWSKDARVMTTIFGGLFGVFSAMGAVMFLEITED